MFSRARMIPPPVKIQINPFRALRGFDFFPRAVGVLRQREKHQFGTAVASPLAAMSGLRTVPRWHGLLNEKHPDRGNCPIRAAPAQQVDWTRVPVEVR